MRIALSVVALSACQGIQPMPADRGLLPSARTEPPPTSSYLTIAREVEVPLAPLVERLEQQGPGAKLQADIETVARGALGGLTPTMSSATAPLQRDYSSDGGTSTLMVRGSGVTEVTAASKEFFSLLGWRIQIYSATVTARIDWAYTVAASVTLGWTGADRIEIDGHFERTALDVAVSRSVKVHLSTTVVANGSSDFLLLGHFDMPQNEVEARLALIRMQLAIKLEVLRSESEAQLQALLDQPLADARSQLRSFSRSFPTREFVTLDANFPMCITANYAHVTPLRFDGDKLRTALGVNLTAELIDSPGQCPNRGNPLLLDRVSELKGKTPIYLRRSTPVELSDLGFNARRALRGQRFGSGARELEVTNVKVRRQDTSSVIVELTCEGSFNGSLFLAGIPMFDAVNQELGVPGLEWSRSSTSLMRESLTWMSADALRDAVRRGLKKGSAVDLERVSREARDKRLAGDHFGTFKVRDVVINPLPVTVLPERLTINLEFAALCEDKP
jgi:Domain of unknown function (DUF4403)